MDGHHQHQLHQNMSHNQSQQSANAQIPQPHPSQQATHAQPPQQLLAYVTGGNQCENCRTTQTCMWRRGGESGDMLLCNKCGLYYTRKGYHRPQLNRKPTVRRRTNKRRKVDLAQNPGSMLDASVVPSSSSTPSPSAFIHHAMSSPSGIQKSHRMTVGLLQHHQQQQQHHHHHQQPLVSLPPFHQGSSIAVPIPGPYHHTASDTQNPESDSNNKASAGRGNTPVMLNVTREQASQLLKGIKKAVGIPDNDNDTSEKTKD